MYNILNPIEELEFTPLREGMNPALIPFKSKLVEYTHLYSSIVYYVNGAVSVQLFIEGF